MRDMILGFNQKACQEMKLDIKDVVILKYMLGVMDSEKVVKKVINNKEYCWIKIGAIQEKLYLLEINSRATLRRRIKKLVDNKILDNILLKKEGTYSYFSKGENLNKLLEGTLEKNKTDKLEVKKVEDRVAVVDCKSEICDKVIGYLNKKANTTHSSTFPYNQKLVGHLIDAGYSVEDIKKVIDSKVKCWKGTKYQNGLAPSTLFNMERFVECLNGVGMAKVINKDFEDDYIDWGELE